MEVTVCGVKKEVPEGTTVLQVLEEGNIEIPGNVLVRRRDVQLLPPKGPGEPPQVVTLAVNDRMVMRKDLGATPLKPGDEVDCLYFEAGG